VLVYGATGVIGSAAVQLLKSLGASVTAVCGTGNVELVTGLGADRVIDYTAGDFTKDDQAYDVVLDAVGKSSFSRCKRLLKRRGSISRRTWARCPRTRSWRSSHGCSAARRSCSRSRKHDQEGVRNFRELIESGVFEPVIDRTYPLDQIVEAYKYVETGQKIGNVVISVEPSN
jgi:NADPH:quinone reductase-like Zn-dependent oxidoreductase